MFPSRLLHHTADLSFMGPCCAAQPPAAQTPLAPAAPPAATDASGSDGQIFYSSLERDPFRLAAEVGDGRRSDQRREAFAEAYAYIQKAEALLVAGHTVAAAASIMQAYWHSEGLLELSRRFQDLMISPGILKVDAPGAIRLLVYALVAGSEHCASELLYLDGLLTRCRRPFDLHTPLGLQYVASSPYLHRKIRTYPTAQSSMSMAAATTMSAWPCS